MNKTDRGRLAYLAGSAAEEQVARHYAERGHQILARRWRGQAGEIDLIFKSREDVIFVEVKRAASHAEAACRISRRQQLRLCAAAEEYLGSTPAGTLTPMRVDAAFVDAFGAVQIVENAIAA